MSYMCNYNGKTMTGYYSKDIDECFDSIRMSLEWLESSNDKLIQENKRLKDDAYKDSEIAELSRELDEVKDELHNGFGITQKETVQIDHWCRKHSKKCRQQTYEYIFSPTSIGVSGTIRCTCGAKFEFSSL